LGALEVRPFHHFVLDLLLLLLDVLLDDFFWRLFFHAFGEGLFADVGLDFFEVLCDLRGERLTLP
jgi:hypothetical protein